MILLRPANQRGHTQHGWLTSWHTFSFASYRDPNFMGFSALRVINEDVIEPNSGFLTHPHQDMEILTYVIAGTIEHQDSMGNKRHIDTGEFQIMSAGTGVKHSEYNASKTDPLHIYQIWIIPEKTGLPPRYDQKKFAQHTEKQLILSPDSQDGSLKIFQDLLLWRWQLQPQQSVQVVVKSQRRLWIQVVEGCITINQTTATTGDGIAIWDEQPINLIATKNNEILLFDLKSQV